MGVDTAFVPFEFKQGDKYVGFDIDLWDAIAKKMHISYELRPMDFGGLIPGLQSRNLDVAMAGITITDARKQVVDFSEGYYNADLLIAVKSNDNSIVKFSDLTGKKVGLKQGTAAASLSLIHIFLLGCIRGAGHCDKQQRGGAATANEAASGQRAGNRDTTAGR